MHRIPKLRHIAGVLLAGLFVWTSGCTRSNEEPIPARQRWQEVAMNENGQVTMSDEEWKNLLTPEQYRVAREGGTERAFSGEYWNTTETGTYHCICCGQALYSSETKFHSGTGWPSYTAPVETTAVRRLEDRSFGMVRTEVRCSRCDAHLGHVFPDGPEPTGERHCINSVSLKFLPEGQSSTPK